MKSLLLSLALAAGLSGCAVYGDPYGGYQSGGYYGQPDGYYAQPNVYYDAQPNIYFGGSYYGGQPGYRGEGRRGNRDRDRDRDGTPDRYDSDRDGDGVRNRNDARPNNPRRY